MASQEIIVIKIGTSSITDIKSGVDYKTINLLAKAVAELKAQGAHSCNCKFWGDEFGYL